MVKISIKLVNLALVVALLMLATKPEMSLGSVRQLDPLSNKMMLPPKPQMSMSARQFERYLHRRNSCGAAGMERCVWGVSSPWTYEHPKYMAKAECILSHHLVNILKNSSLGDDPMEEIDPTFINSVEIKPKSTNIEDQLPIIDLAPINWLDNLPITNSTIVNDSKLQALVAEIGRACEKWGFFQVINHGIPLEKIKNLEKASSKFFGQSKEEKRKVLRCVNNPLGYSHEEHTGNVRDWKEGFTCSVEDSTLSLVSPAHPSFHLRNRWPDYPPELRDVTQEYAKGVTRLGLKLLELIALSLGLAANRLTDYFEGRTSNFLINWYMPCPSPERVLGIGAHKDIDALTLVSQDDVGGLQVKRKSDGEWIDIKPIPGAFVVNIGNVLQVWSNGKYESVEHRVTVNRDKYRISIAFHFGPSYNVDVKVVEELVDEHNPPKYKEYNYGEFCVSALKSYAMKADQVHNNNSNSNTGFYLELNDI